MPATNTMSSHPSRKAFYILLCAVLGALLFLVLQRSAALIVYLLLNSDYQAYSLGLSAYQLQLLDWGTLLAAVFFGLWYGTWLGLHWYDIVYEQNRGGLFHGFKGHWLRRDPEEVFTKKTAAAGSSASPAVGSVTVKPAVKPVVKLTDKRSADPGTGENWDLDDLLKPDIAPMRGAVKPNTAAKLSSSKRRAPVKRINPADAA